MRMSISAQSLASVPPSRALIVRMARVGVQGAVQQGLDLQLVQVQLRGATFAGHLGGKALVLIGHFDHGRQVLARPDDLVQRAQQGLQRLQLGDDFLGLLLIAPEVGGGHLFFDGFDFEPVCRRSQRESRSWRIRFWIISARSVNSRFIKLLPSGVVALITSIMLYPTHSDGKGG